MRKYEVFDEVNAECRMWNAELRILKFEILKS